MYDVGRLQWKQPTGRRQSQYAEAAINSDWLQVCVCVGGDHQYHQ